MTLPTEMHTLNLKQTSRAPCRVISSVIILSTIIFMCVTYRIYYSCDSFHEYSAFWFGEFWDIVDDIKLEKCKAISQLNREHIAGTVATTTF